MYLEYNVIDVCFLLYCLGYFCIYFYFIFRVRRSTVQICLYCVNMYVCVYIVGVYFVYVYVCVLSI